MEPIVSAAIDGAITMFKFIRSRTKILFKYGKNILELREQFENLLDKKISIEEDVTLAKMEGKTPKTQVIEWLMKVSRAEDAVRPLLDKLTHQYHKCWTVAKKLDLVKELNSTHFETVAIERSSPINSVVEMAVPPLVGKGAASDMKRLLEILNRDDSGRIGVWGEVSDAKRIHLKLEADDTTNSIASRILQRLKLRRKILLILDDVWEKIDLDAVGIPSNDTCCKVLLTTRSLDVCRRMDVVSPFQLNLMNEEDAWKLFANSVGPVVHSDGIESIARKMSASCHGLPSAIKCLGNSMRGVSLVELWKNADRSWRCSSPLFNNINQEVYQRLALSYHSLPSKDLKQCFLYCSLYPESFSINVDCSIEALPSLVSFRKLLVLDLSGTLIKALPKGLGSLHSLRELDVSCTHFLERIIAGSISGLSSLETLNMSCSAFNWNRRAADQRKPLDELLRLDHLSVLKIRLDSVECLKSASSS
ncbi:hypothetical protein L1987_19617 [Smallanthus sonchifolius]|uniref:Uncharacterized protein n=1 Tax=Smallanthus sonchifolius TaxID=185202 RepID=A0ACB9ISI4_9ASTR|nr:hypothetical protein L1987_19617 [Smallanthus sonchifolius]